MTTGNGSHKTKSRWALKTLLGLVLLLIAALAVATWKINSIAQTQINNALSEFLTAGGVVEDIDIHLLTGQVHLENLTIHSPKGFDATPPLTLKNLQVNIKLLSLLDEEDIEIQQLSLSDISLTLIRNKQGQLNLLNIIPDNEQKIAPKTIKEKEASKPLSIPAIHISSVRIDKLSLHVIDQTTKEHWTGDLQLDLAVDNIQLKDLNDLNILTGKVALALSDIKLDQPPGFSTSPLFELKKLTLELPEIDLLSPKWNVTQVAFETLNTSIERDAEGRTNLQQLVESWFPPNSATNKTQKSETTKKSPPLPELVFEDIHLKSFKLQLLDNIKGKPWNAGFDDLDIQVTGLELGKQQLIPISLNAFKLSLKGLSVDQAPTFDGETLLSLTELTIDTEKLLFSDPELVIKDITAQELFLSLDIPAVDTSNIRSLVSALFNSKETSSNKELTSSPTPQTQTAGGPLPTINLNHVAIKNSSLMYRNGVLTKETLVFPLNDIEIEAKQLRLYDNSPTAQPADLTLSFKLEQPKDLPVAYFGGLANVGPINNDTPKINAQIRAAGINLDTLGTLVSSTTRKTLGIDGFDVGVVLAMDADSIKLQASVLSDQNIQYDAIKVQGPLTSPNVEVGEILAGVYSRISNALFSVGKSGWNLGGDIASESANTVKSVGVGAFNIGKNLGKSLFEAGTGLVTLDQKQLSEGLVGTTKGTFNTTTDSVSGVGSAASGMLKSPSKSLSGDASMQQWNKLIKTRFDTMMSLAQKKLPNMHYPPVTDMPQQPVPSKVK